MTAINTYGGDQMSAQRQYSFNIRQRIYFTTYISIRLPTYSAIKRQTPSPPPTIETAAATNITHIVYTKMCLFYLICTLCPCSMEMLAHIHIFIRTHNFSTDPDYVHYSYVYLLCTQQGISHQSNKNLFYSQTFFFIAMAKSELPLAF